MERDFKGIWTPSSIWLDDRLTALDKAILMEIDSLDQGDGCYATNEYIAKFCGCSVPSVTRSISRLKECGYIKEGGFDGRKRTLVSLIKLISLPNQNDYPASSKRLGDNTNRDNIYDIYSPPTPPSKKDVVDEYTQNAELREAIRGLIEARKAAKKPMTPRAVELLLKKLDGIAQTDDEKIRVVNQSIERGWMTVYPIDSSKRGDKREYKSFDTDDFFRAAVNK